MASILVVDDHPLNRQFLVTLLAYRHHRMLEAADGAAALEVARAERPNLIISDILMPTMDGFEFIRQLRADPAIATIPVIFCSAHYLQREARHLAQACNVAWVITKPAEPEDVLRVVETALEQQAVSTETTPVEFDREHLRLITDTLSRKVRELSATNERLTAMIELAQDLAAERVPADLLESFCHAARRIIGSRYSLVGVLDEDGERLASLAVSGMPDEDVRRLGAVAARDGVFSRMLAERKPLRLHFPEPRLPDGLPSRHPPVTSVLVVPIASLVRVYGWLCLADKVGLPEFSGEDERLAAALSGLVGRIYESGALFAAEIRHAEMLRGEVAERLRAEEALRRQAQRLETLRHIDQAILAANSPAQIAAAALAMTTPLLPCRFAALLLLDAESATLRIIARQGLPGFLESDEIPVAEFSPAATSVERRRLRVDDLDAYEPAPPAIQRLRDLGMKSLVSEAILAEGDLLGFLAFAAEGVAAFDAEHEEIAREVADQLGIAIRQSGMREELGLYANDLERRVSQRTAQLEAVNRELHTFGHSVSDDLRAPLRVIDGFSKALLDDYGDVLGDEGRKFVQGVRTGTHRIGALVDELLHLSRVTQVPMRPQEVDLSRVAQAIAADLQKAEPERQAEFVVSAGLTAVADPRLMRLALQNLLNNGWKYTSKRPRARIEFGLTRSGDENVFFVRDNGAGFDMANASDLFGTFKRLHSEEEFEGTGIGLATVQRVIHRHGGRIWASAELNQGATFYFTLPPPERSSGRMRGNGGA